MTNLKETVRGIAMELGVESPVAADARVDEGGAALDARAGHDRATAEAARAAQPTGVGDDPGAAQAAQAAQAGRAMQPAAVMARDEDVGRMTAGAGAGAATGGAGPASMASPARVATSQASEYAIYTSAGRIFIQDAQGKVIDVGELEEQAGRYAYRLDAGAIQGSDFDSLGAALRAMAGQLTYLYLNDLFARLPDDAAEAAVHSISMPAVRVTLAPGTDELHSSAGMPGAAPVRR